MSRRSLILPDDPRAVAWRKAQALAGGNRHLARHFGISSPAVAQWKICPPERVLEIERLSGMPRYELRPDVFGEFATDVAGGDRLPEMSVDQALVAFGKRQLAEALSLTIDEIDAWDAVPPTLVLKVEKLTGISRYVLRPDVFGEMPEREVAA